MFNVDLEQMNSSACAPWAAEWEVGRLPMEVRWVQFDTISFVAFNGRCRCISMLPACSQLWRREGGGARSERERQGGAGGAQSRWESASAAADGAEAEGGAPPGWGDYL